jgi:hypothetical protein
MRATDDNGVQNSWQSKAYGLAGVMGIIAVMTVVSSWFFVARALDAKGGTALAYAVAISAALVGTAGCALYIYAIARGFHFWAALGLVGVLIAPTGFAYAGNLLALVAAALLVFVGVRERRRGSRQSQTLAVSANADSESARSAH